MNKRITFVAALLLAATSTFSLASAQSADDRKWVAQCLKDNSDAKVSIQIVTTYCVCMNNKMSDNETRSITVWEKANPNARKACEAQSGWL